MTLDVSTAASAFGSGCQEPYALALAAGGGMLHLEAADGTQTADPLHYDVAAWCAPAGACEYELLENSAGPLLDLGCGPGRMVEAAGQLGLPALGVDFHPLAVELTRRRGCSALQRSLFDSLPRAGEWMSVLLLDGNIGIGGDPRPLLARARDLVHPRGRIVVETEPRADLDLRYAAVLTDDTGRASAPFPWARIGGDAIASYALTAGLTEEGTVLCQGRTFSLLRRSET